MSAEPRARTAVAEWNVVVESVVGIAAHVSCFGYDPIGEVWLIIDPRRNVTEVRALKPDAFDDWLVCTASDDETEIFRIGAGDRTRVWFPGLWCVGAVKRVIGLRSGALSPGGLRRDLLRAGARRVFTRESQNPRPYA